MIRPGRSEADFGRCSFDILESLQETRNIQREGDYTAENFVARYSGHTFFLLTCYTDDAY